MEEYKNINDVSTLKKIINDLLKQNKIINGKLEFYENRYKKYYEQNKEKIIKHHA